MYKGNKRELVLLVLKEIGGVVCIIGEAKVVRVRVWAMTGEADALRQVALCIRGK